MHDGHVHIGEMSKVYGHAGLDIKIRSKNVKDVKLNITESSRYFESLVKNKRFDIVNSIASRICGICSPSHNVTSTMAVEDAFGIEPSEQVKKLRELYIYGGWIQSHPLHTYFLALPDYLGYSSILDMARDYKTDVERALRLKKLGNEMAAHIGGRDVHASSTTIGGITNFPERDDLSHILDLLKKGRNDAMKGAKLFASLKKPKFERRRNFISLKERNEYAIVSGKAFCDDEYLSPKDYRSRLITEKRPYSTAKFVTMQKKEFMVGPLARANNSHNNLSKGAKKALRIMDLELPNYSPFNSNLVRIAELVHCIEKSIDIIKSTKFKPEKNKFNFSKLKKNSYEGHAITEAPRGVLYHSYKIDRDGTIINADIITPTAKNLLTIETDIWNFMPGIINKPRNKIVKELEELVRSYDPCISCATHFLEVKFL